MRSTPPLRTSSLLRAGRKVPPAALLFLASLPCAAQQEEPSAQLHGAIGIFATWGSWEATGLPDGRLIMVDVAEGRRVEWRTGTEPILTLAVEPAGADVGGASAAPDLVAAVPSKDQAKPVTLLRISGRTGERLGEIPLAARPRWILPSPNGDVYVVTPARAARAGARRETDGTEEVLVSASFSARKRAGEAVSIRGVVLGSALSPQGDRVYLSQEGRIRSFLTQPLRSSWMLRSPGENRGVLPLAGGQILVARDASLVRFDPDNLPGKNAAGGAPADDDAGSKLALPFEAASLEVSGDGAEAAVLNKEGTRMALVDLAGWQVREVRRVPGVATTIFHPSRKSLFVFERDGDLVEIIYGTAAGGSGGAEAAESGPSAKGPEPPPSAPPPPARPAPGSASAAVAEPESGPASEPAPGPAHEPGTQPAEAEPPAKGTEPATAPAAPSKPPATGQAPAQKPTEGKQGAAHSGEGPAPPSEPKGEVRPAPTGSPRSAEPTEPSTPGYLTGRVTGETSLVDSVVLYGPDSILEEHARVALDAQGRFKTPLPPPGRYRVVIAGKSGAQLFVKPPLRVIDVGSRGIGSLDFMVISKLPGSIEE